MKIPRTVESISGSRLWIILILSCIVTSLRAQENQPAKRTQFLFPEFTDCTVKMKTGMVNHVTANYNTLTEKMVFLKDKTPYDLTVTTFVDTITFSGRHFIPVKEVFYEVLVDAPVSLLVQHKSNLTDPGQPSGYGGRSSTSAIDRVKVIQSDNHHYNLPIPEEYTIASSNVFWVRKENQLVSFVNKRQLLKIFPGRADEIGKFISQHRLKTDNCDDMKMLFEYYNNL